MSIESIRTIVKQRDALSDADIDEMFEEAQKLIAEGADPEEVLHDVFGLEPDYIFDRELGLM